MVRRFTLPAIISMSLMMTGGSAFAVEIIAHRGASFDAPENTLSAVRTAWEQGADAVEIDIWITKDNYIVAHHDETTKKTAGKDVPVAHQSLAELQALDFGRWKDPRFAGERIATLREILATVPEGKRLFIEIKAGQEIIPTLKDVLSASDIKPEQTALIGFSLETLQAVKESLPDRKVFWIAGLKQNQRTKEWTPPVSNLVRRATEAGMDGLDVESVPAIDAAYVQTVKDAGLEFYVWTVNDAAEAARLVEAGVDGITTDRPGWLCERLNRRVEE
ncbi:MAG: glycerophosphodiester phosphodiesterase [Planctomycetaceae bacterium]